MSKKEKDIRLDKITDIIDTINVVYEMRCDGCELKKSVYLDYRNGKYYVYYATENNKYFLGKARFESYNLGEIKTYLTWYLDAL